jgi:hypothetical protein
MADRTAVAVTRRAMMVRPTEGVVCGWTTQGVHGRWVGRHGGADARLRIGSVLASQPRGGGGDETVLPMARHGATEGEVKDVRYETSLQARTYRAEEAAARGRRCDRVVERSRGGEDKSTSVSGRL